jgi:hypothetical protein
MIKKKLNQQCFFLYWSLGVYLPSASSKNRFMGIDEPFLSFWCHFINLDEKIFFNQFWEGIFFRIFYIGINPTWFQVEICHQIEISNCLLEKYHWWIFFLFGWFLQESNCPKIVVGSKVHYFGLLILKITFWFTVIFGVD